MVYERTYGDPQGKIDPSRLAFQGQSRSFEGTRNCRLPAVTSYWCSMGLYTSYRFRDKRRFRSKIAKFSHAHGGSAWTFVTAVGL